MDQASWGGYVRHNELYRRIYDLEGGLLEEEFLFANDAIMMYSPLLRRSPDAGLYSFQNRGTLWTTPLNQREVFLWMQKRRVLSLILPGSVW